MSKDCISCKWNRGEWEPRKGPQGGIYRLRDYPEWYVNHYGGGYVGWLVLQPKECVHQIARIKNSNTLEQMGRAIKVVAAGMITIWPKEFSGNRLQRVHTVSFMESPSDYPSPSESFHVHIHLIPRSERIGKLIRRHLNGVRQNVPWDDYKIPRQIAHSREFILYRRNLPRVAKFMKALGNQVDFVRVRRSSKG